MISFHLKDKELLMLPDNELTDVVNSVVTRQVKDELENYVFDVVKDTRAHIDLTAELEDDKKLEFAIAENRNRRQEEFTEKFGESAIQTAKTQLVRSFSKSGSKKVLVNEDEEFDEGFDSKVMYIVNNNTTAKVSSKSTGSRVRKVPSTSQQIEDLSEIDSASDDESIASSKRLRTGTAPRKVAKLPSARTLGGSLRTSKKKANPFI